MWSSYMEEEWYQKELKAQHEQIKKKNKED